jgi:hypothetical protein
MKHVLIESKKTACVVLTSLAVGLAGVAHSQNDTSRQGASGAKPESRGTSSGIMDNPTRGGTEKSLGSSRSGSSGSGAASGSSSSTPPQGSSLGGSTGDKGFSNLRENKGGAGSQSTLGGSTDSKAGDAGTGGRTRGSSSGDSRKP